jgi:hypothetical protein
VADNKGREAVVASQIDSIPAQLVSGIIGIMSKRPAASHFALAIEYYREMTDAGSRPGIGTVSFSSVGHGCQN